MNPLKIAEGIATKGHDTEAMLQAAEMVKAMRLSDSDIKLVPKVYMDPDGSNRGPNVVFQMPSGSAAALHDVRIDAKIARQLVEGYMLLYVAGCIERAGLLDVVKQRMAGVVEATIKQATTRVQAQIDAAVREHVAREVKERLSKARITLGVEL